MKRCPPSSLVGSSDRQSSASTAAKPKGTNMGAIDINTLTIEQYLALTRRDIPDVVIPELGNDVDFEIQSQFMSELRCNLFACTDEEDAHEHVRRVLEITDLFYIPDVTRDAVMLRVLPITLTGAKLEEIRNFKQGLDETLYQAWERYNDLLFRCPQHDLNNHQKKLKESIHAIQVKYIGLLEETINKFIEESNKKQAAFDEWIRKFRDCTNLNLRMLDVATKNLQERAEQLTQEILTNNMIDNAKTKMRKDIEVRKELVPFDLPNANPYVEPTVPRVPFPRHLKEQEDEAQAFRTSALADLGASINIMPFSMFKRLQIENLQPPNMMVEMVDITMKAPRGIIENILVQIDKFIFPVNFIIMDKVEDPNVPLILGRPLLATAYAQIDVFNKQISLGVGEERILFKMNEIVDDPYTTHESVCMIECSRETHKEELEMLLASDPQSSFTKIQEADLELSLEHVVSSSYQANPGE
ncbi:oligopeptide transporter [Tanacetum coccineum]